MANATDLKSVSEKIMGSTPIRTTMKDPLEKVIIILRYLVNLYGDKVCFGDVMSQIIRHSSGHKCEGAD